jgi:hypothetical protein
LAGNSPANNIVAWDGTSWHSLGSGINNYVYAVAVFNNDLIAAGWFWAAGGMSANRIARWDGKNWHALGTGINGYVNALTVSNNELIAGGASRLLVA